METPAVDDDCRGYDARNDKWDWIAYEILRFIEIQEWDPSKVSPNSGCLILRDADFVARLGMAPVGFLAGMLLRVVEKAKPSGRGFFRKTAGDVAARMIRSEIEGRQETLDENALEKAMENERTFKNLRGRCNRAMREEFDPWEVLQTYVAECVT